MNFLSQWRRAKVATPLRLGHWRLLIASCCVGVSVILSGCGLLFGSAPEPTPTVAEPRALVPTFTPTTVSPPTSTAAPTLPPAPPTATTALTKTQSITTTKAITANQAVTQTKAVTPTLPTTSAPKARLAVNTDLVNLRLGPGTDYGLAGTAPKGQEFDIVGKTQAGDWWQICCVNGQQAWILSELAQVRSSEGVPVVTNLPPKPVAAAPTPAPAQPTPTPQPQQVQAPAAPDPCATIGGDGCKFKLRNGPKFGANGGNELKFQIDFIHSGNGGEAQGSYFIVVLKDGQKLPIGDDVRSIARTKQQSGLGEYNYEYKLSPGQLPGNNVAGNYVIYVLDGNGERDSKDFGFTVPDGQGEVWIEFDQG